MAELEFSSRRSTVYGLRYAVASSQPLASSIGMDVLSRGGNAADACVAISAALAVCEPCSTGMGGDCFALFYRATDGKVEAMMANGPSGAKTRTDIDELGLMDGLCVTVPGAAGGWCEAVKRWGGGRIDLKGVLEGAVELAERGFPVGEVCAAMWKNDESLLKEARGGGCYLVEGRAPRSGEVFRNPDLAKTLKLLGSKGRDGFYKGRVAEEIVQRVEEVGGVLTLEDLEAYRAEFVEPIKAHYRGYNVYEVPPPTHGIAALIALRIADGFEIQKLGQGSVERMHILIECMRLAYAEASAHVCDPKVSKDRCSELLDEKFIQELRNSVSDVRAMVDPRSALRSCDTVQFCAVDAEGNACSMINSNYMGFGTGHVPEGCGFTLQNRGLNFVLNNPSHPNAIGPRKRPYHTIIPGLITRENGEFDSVFGVMGGFMQPQGHLQIVSNLIDFKMEPQAALDKPRFKVSGPSSDKIHATDVVFVEDGTSDETIKGLRERGHTILGPVRSWDRMMFGRGQIIRRDANGILSAGSDPRADGAALVM